MVLKLVQGENDQSEAILTGAWCWEVRLCLFVRSGKGVNIFVTASSCILLGCTIYLIVALMQLCLIYCQSFVNDDV